MSSGNDRSASGLDRILKLWISLWNLVLGNKRHYETVCAVLQRLVFEKTSWPKFKNWPVICELGKSEPLMRQILLELDLSVVNERNARIIAAFGDCFSQTKVSGIPLSVIQNRIVEDRYDNRLAYSKEEELQFVRRGAVLFVCLHPDVLKEYGLPPTFLYWYDDGDLSGVDVDGFHDAPCHVCPESLRYLKSKDGVVWTQIQFQNNQYVIIEVDDDAKRITLIPAELIALDL
jgi:hypothetical protein